MIVNLQKDIAFIIIFVTVLLTINMWLIIYMSPCWFWPPPGWAVPRQESSFSPAPSQTGHFSKLRDQAWPGISMREAQTHWGPLSAWDRYTRMHQCHFCAMHNVHTNCCLRSGHEKTCCWRVRQLLAKRSSSTSCAKQKTMDKY